MILDTIDATCRGVWLAHLINCPLVVTLNLTEALGHTSFSHPVEDANSMQPAEWLHLLAELAGVRGEAGNDRGL